MVSRIHQKLGTAGFIIAIVALVAAMTGGAYAASKGLTGKQKKEVTKIAQTQAKKLAGKEGKAGAPGSPGAVGPAGPTGAKGADGSNGSNGADGAPGANGKTILNGTATPTAGVGTVGDFYLRTGASPLLYGPKESSGTNGGWGNGTSLKGSAGESGKTILSGIGAPDGSEGTEGDFYLDTAAVELYGPKNEAEPSPWGTGTSLVGPAGPEGNIKETLSAGIPLKGTWVAGPFTATAAGEPVFADLSLNIPFAAGSPQFIFMKEGESQSPLPPEPAAQFRSCEGGPNSPTVSAPSEPATSGSDIVCIFTTKAQNWDIERNALSFALANNTGLVSPTTGASRRLGAVIQGKAVGAGASYAYGTWVAKQVP